MGVFTFLLFFLFFLSYLWPVDCVLSMWGKIMISMFRLWKPAYMDYKGLAVCYLKKAVNLNHSLTFRIPYPLYTFFGVIWWRHQMEIFDVLLCEGNPPVTSLSDWRGALMFSLIYGWRHSWGSNRNAGDLRRHCAHYDVTVMMSRKHIPLWWAFCWIWLRSCCSFSGPHVRNRCQDRSWWNRKHLHTDPSYNVQVKGRASKLPMFVIKYMLEECVIYVRLGVLIMIFKQGLHAPVFQKLRECVDILGWASYQMSKIVECACAGNAWHVFPITPTLKGTVS